jgi:MBG domain (YGX type)
VTASSPGVTYGDPVPAISPSYTGFVNGDTAASLTARPTCSTTYAKGAVVGSYSSTCLGAVDGNYNIAYTSGSVAVGKAGLTVTAANASMVEGAKVPTLTGSVVGLKGTDAITATYATTATSASPAGTYPITPTLHDPGNRLANYAVSVVPGTLTVSYVASGSTCVLEGGHTILAPISAKGTSVFKVGTIVLARFRVCDATGKSIGTAGVVKSFALVETIHGSTITHVNQAVASATSAKSFTWDSLLREWEFAIATKGLAKGTTYVYSITLNDGSSIGFQFTTS